MRLDAKQLRKLKKPARFPSIKRRPLFFILEDVLDTYNVGGLFRLADALAAEKIYLCGLTETPPNHKIKKASVGTYKVVPWEYKKTAVEAIEKLREQSNLKLKMKNEKVKFNEFLISNIKYPIAVIAVEQHPKALLYTDAKYKLPLALIFGNETDGIKQETLKLADFIVEIPLFGINKSLNVIVSAAIVSYHILVASSK